VVAVRKYFDSFSAVRKKENRTFRKRTVWHSPDDGVRPHAFFSCMQTYGPTLVLNLAGVTCTNTVYRVTFRSEVDLSAREFLATAVQSTLTQVSAEIEGRSYGSGGLKVEPSEAARIVVLVATSADPALISGAFSRANDCIRSGDREGARRVADALLTSCGLVTAEENARLQDALNSLRRSRMGSKRRKSFK
jgi:adenine-specific DNA-methyltransferase